MPLLFGANESRVEALPDTALATVTDVRGPNRREVGIEADAWIAGRCCRNALVMICQSGGSRTRAPLDFAIADHQRARAKRLGRSKSIVERESGGEIKIEIHPSAELYKDKEVPSCGSVPAPSKWVLLRSRAFHVSTPVVQSVKSSFRSLVSNEDIAAATAPGHPIRATLDREILATGARPLWWQAFGLAVMLGKDVAPLHPDDLKGKRTRVFARHHARVRGGHRRRSCAGVGIETV